jgi:hypothetical protein
VLPRLLLLKRIALPISDEPLTSYAKELQLLHLWRSRRLDLTRAGHSRRTRFYGRLLLCSGRCGRPEFSPTVALESHTIGVFQGAMLFGLAAVWPSLGSGWAVKIAQYRALVGFYANCKFKAAVTAKRSGALLQFCAIAGDRLDGSERSYFSKSPGNSDALPGACDQ